MWLLNVTTTAAVLGLSQLIILHKHVYYAVTCNCVCGNAYYIIQNLLNHKHHPQEYLLQHYAEITPLICTTYSYAVV